MTRGQRPTGEDRFRRIEDWSDEELVAEYRHLKNDPADQDRESRHAPAHIVEKEMERRALSPDREDVIPDAATPGRDSEPSPDFRPTAPDAGEDTAG